MPTQTSALREELKQTRPFQSPAHEALLSVLRTAAVVQRVTAQVVEPSGITVQQYNVLRILRGAGTAGLCRNEIGERLISRTPDVTRLLDRMETAGLVSRARSTEDRRLVNTVLTAKGRRLVDELDDDVARAHEGLLGHLTKAQLRTLVDLLALARSTE